MLTSKWSGTHRRSVMGALWLCSMLDTPLYLTIGVSRAFSSSNPGCNTNHYNNNNNGKYTAQIWTLHVGTKYRKSRIQIPYLYLVPLFILFFYFGLRIHTHIHTIRLINMFKIEYLKHLKQSIIIHINYV